MTVLQKNPGKWNKTIDRIVPALKDSPKVLLPDISGNQLLSITNRMNGGYPRWQSQYLRKLVMPDVNAVALERLSKGCCCIWFRTFYYICTA